MRLDVPEDKRVVISFNGKELSLTISEEGELMPTPPNGSYNGEQPFRGKEFSPIEKSIVEVLLAAEGWMTKTEIAQKCGHSVSSWFSYALANLADRDYLESGRNGYRLKRANRAN